MTFRQSQAIESKERIRRKAMELFKSIDYEQVSIYDICQSAGMSVGSFYRYFTSKEELIMKSYASFDVSMEERLADKPYQSRLEALEDALYHLALSADHYGNKLCAQMLRIQLKDESNKQTLELRRFHHYFEDLVKQAVDSGELATDHAPEEIALMLLRLTRGTFFDWAVCGGTYSLTERVLQDAGAILKTMKPR